MILLALGANISSPVGPPSATLQAALNAMAAQKICVLKVSAFYQTPAWPDPSEPAFVNAVALVETSLDPPALLTALHALEAQFGRLRTRSNAPRTLDIDLLDYDGGVEEGWPLLPHPRLAERAFVLVPLADVAPDWRHPLSGRALAELLEALPKSERTAIKRLNP
ncbi:MAG: 2-amino-4-hydroxy-6-hydroxymethyldihydropteridine diphosphokinase [Rhizomicrobium sp.]|nr:2-amino-4-hydroxy-6-hydroxymethyldihydropteridine diphosphokinase [Rhizomicrobium sp.]